ncbi:MAG: MFS transporter [Coriobacteriaceae bacterium]|jgi:MFS family permease|nr:MFS transporter [Coriobacteriaceae bacterium]
MENKKPRIMSRNYVIITLTNFVNASNFYLLTVVSSGYVRDAYGADDAGGGVAAGIFVVGALLSRAVCGRMLGLLGYRKTLVIGLAVALLSSAAYPFAPTLAWFLVVRTFHGFGFGVIVSATSTIVADIVPPQRVGEGMGYYQLSATVATALGPLIAITLSLMGNYLAIFFLCALLLAACLMLAPLLRLKRVVLDAEERLLLKGFSLAGFIEAPVLPASAVAMMVYFCYGSIVAFLAQFTGTVGIAEATSWFFIAYAIVIIGSRPLVSRVFDSRGLKVVLAPALLLLAGGFLILAFMDGPLLLILSGILVGLGAGAAQSATLSQVAKITPPARKGMATNTFFLLTDVGYSTGPMMGGLLLAATGFSGLYLVMGGIILATLATSMAFSLASGRKPRS